MDYQPLIDRWQADEALAPWAQRLPEQLRAGLSTQRYGDLPGWLTTLADLPDLPVEQVMLDTSRVGADAKAVSDADRETHCTARYWPATCAWRPKPV